MTFSVVHSLGCVSFLLFGCWMEPFHAFVAHSPVRTTITKPNTSTTPTITAAASVSLSAKYNDEDKENGSLANYEETDAASRGLVSSLTGLVNSLSSGGDGDSSSGTTTTATATTTKAQVQQEIPLPPTSPEELRDRLQDDYIVNNYLWTGMLDMACFDTDCRFTDPTISFQGTDKFVENTQNLVPLVERFVVPDSYRSLLLDIQITPDYVETRWNMVGDLAFWWKPKIDVIGRTKFWYTTTTTKTSAIQNEEEKATKDEKVESLLQVYSYDEQWEIPAYQALLQLVTPAGTFPNTALADATLSPPE